MNNPYAPPTADLGVEPRSRGNVARYVIASFFLLYALRDAALLLTMNYLPEASVIAQNPRILAATIATAILHPLAALAFFLRWKFGWWLGLVLVGFPLGSMLPAALRVDLGLFAVWLTPLLLLVILLFSGSVRSTFDVDHRRVFFGIGVLIASLFIRYVVL